MYKFIRRLFYGVIFAIPLMLATYALVLASPNPQSPTTVEGELDCAVCHPAFQEAWEKSAHGMATSDPVFREAWDEQGQLPECLACHVTGYDAETNTWDAEGITCQACHNPVPANHPAEPMVAERSAELCGDCHADTFFEWQISVHQESGLECSACHDPHEASLKAENTALLCASCHQARSSNFTHSAHSQHGLVCVDCHLGDTNREASGGHGLKDHSYFVSLETCNNCHVYEMHDPVDVHEEEQPSEEPPDAMSSADTVMVSAEPAPVSPYGFTALSGLIGVALGVIIAPWIERLQRRSRFEYKDED